MTLNCAIIDDEPLAAQLLQSYVNKTPFLQLTGVYNSAITAMRDLRTSPVNLLLLDIQMPELSGIEFAKILPKETYVIFTTAFPQYAIEGYKVNSIDYLLKPVSYEDFLRATDKALQRVAAQVSHNDSQQERFIYVKSDYKLLRIKLSDILYIEGLKDYVRIYMANGEKIVSLISMKRMEESLPQPEFMRIHRSYIVNMGHVSVVDRNRIVFGSELIPVSDNYKEQLQHYLDHHTLS